MNQFYGVLGFREKNDFLTSTFKIYDSEGNVFKDVDIPTINWIGLYRLNKFQSTDFCSATSWKNCLNCNLYPEFCGTALLYLRTVVSSKGIIKFKIGVSYDIARPLAQSSPFAIIAKDIPRKMALNFEKKLSQISKLIVQNPRGRMLWADVIKYGLWDGELESERLLEFLDTFYHKVERYSPEIYERLIDPIVYVAGPNFYTDLPPWINKLNMFEIRKILKRDPRSIFGEIVSNRGAILVVESEDNAYFFELKERMFYLISKISGETNLSKMYKRVLIKFKEKS